jgi:hypothetical protein
MTDAKGKRHGCTNTKFSFFAKRLFSESSHPRMATAPDVLGGDIRCVAGKDDRTLKNMR